MKFFIFDVESIGLHGEGYAVAGGIWDEHGVNYAEFFFACPPESAEGLQADRDWVAANIPPLESQFNTPIDMRLAFWNQWTAGKLLYPDLVMAGECLWPVEARFLIDCVRDDAQRTWEGPYPFHEIASVMLSAGMDPMATYDRLPDEEPKHHPLGDARQSSRLLREALKRLSA